MEAIGLLVVLTLLPSLIYLHGFVKDSGPWPRRMHDAQVLEELRRLGASTIGIGRDPAPYCLPPVNLFEWRIILQAEPIEESLPPDVIVQPVDALDPNVRGVSSYRQISERTFDDVFPARMSWANKPMVIWVRKELVNE